MADIRGLLAVHDYKYGRPEGGRSAFSAFSDFISQKVEEQKKVNNFNQQLESYKKLKEIASSYPDNSEYKKANDIINSDNNNNNILSVNNTVPYENVSFKDGKIVTEFGFKTPSESERKAEIDRKKAEFEFKKGMDKQELINGFINGQVPEGEILKSAGKLGISNDDYRAALEMKQRLSRIYSQNNGTPLQAGGIQPQVNDVQQQGFGGPNINIGNQQSDFIPSKIDPITGEATDFTNINEIKQKNIADKQSKGLSIETGGKLAMVNQAKKDIQGVRDILFPDGTPQSFRPGVAGLSNLPFIGPAPYNEDAQKVFSRLHNALAAKLRVETGAQANPSEVDNMLKRFGIGITSDPNAAFDNLKRLEDFMDETIKITDPSNVFSDVNQSIDKFLNNNNQITQEQALEELRRRGLLVN